MIKPIVGDLSILKKKCALVSKDEDITQIIQDLEDTLATKKGYGMGANQIGYDKQISIIRVHDWKLDLINPVIIAKEDKVVFPKEGCLSFPGLLLDTDRYNSIVIETGFEPDRKRYYHIGLEAIVLQHEIDHLMGITFFQRKHKGK